MGERIVMLGDGAVGGYVGILRCMATTVAR
jgi:hypothetical protein